MSRKYLTNNFVNCIIHCEIIRLDRIRTTSKVTYIIVVLDFMVYKIIEVTTFPAMQLVRSQDRFHKCSNIVSSY